jgi:hypothetical protein
VGLQVGVERVGRLPCVDYEIGFSPGTGGVSSAALSYAATCVADDVISGGGRDAYFPEHDVSAGLQ